MLVLTGMSLANRETPYEEAKTSVKTFIGEESKVKESHACIKLDETSLDENEEAL